MSEARPDREPAEARARVLAVAIGAAGVLSAGLVLARGVDETGALLHQREPYFDLAIFHWQAGQLDEAQPVISQRWFYPPFALLALRPLAWLALADAQNAWLALQAILALALMAACAHVLALLPRFARYAAAFGFVVASLPLWHCIGAGQVSLLLTVLAIVGLASVGQRGPAVLAAAAAFKLYPMLFALPYAMRLRRDYLLRFALWLGGLGVLLPWVALPRGSIPRLWQQTWAIVSDRLRPLYDGSQSVRALLERLFHSGSIFDAPPRPLWFTLPYPALAAVTTLANLAIVGVTALSLRRLPPTSPLAIALVLSAITLVIDPGWAHYFVELSYAQAVLLAHARGRIVPLALCALSFALSSGPLIAALLRPELVARVFQLSTITMAGLVVLLGLWATAWLERQSLPRTAATASASL